MAETPEGAGCARDTPGAGELAEAPAESRRARDTVSVALGALMLAGCCVVIVFPYAAIAGVPLGYGLSWAGLERSVVVSAVVFVGLKILEFIGMARRGEVTVVELVRGLWKETPFDLGVAAAFLLMSWPATYAYCAFRNSQALGEVVQLACVVEHCGTKRCTVTCRDRAGRVHEDMPHRDTWIPPVGSAFQGFARQGSLGVWILDTSSVRVTPAPTSSPLGP